MKALDTNVLVRWFTRDDQHQASIADALLHQPVFVSLTVLIEVAWVLRGRTYRYTAEMLHAAISTLIDLETVVVEDEAGVRWALARQATGAHFADMIHMICARGAASFATFEKGIVQAAGDAPPVPVETLA